MELEEFYKQVGGNFEDVKRRLLNEEFIRKFVLKFKDDETFDNLIDAFNKADYKEAFRFIHTLKGTSVNLGFDDLYQASSIFVGEESGRLESMLTTLADDFDFEAEQASERMITLIQPLMIIFLAVVICLIIISVLLPIYTLYNNVGNM